MDADRCLFCGRIIPEGRMICPRCEKGDTQIGTILQSENATEEEVRDAYEWLYSSIEDTIDMT